MKNVILAHAARYPEMQAQDYIKLIYQSEFGGSHFVADEKAALIRLKEECDNLPEHVLHENDPFEPVGCGMMRMYLSRTLVSKISIETLNRMAVLSANAKRGSMMHFKQKCAVLRSLIGSGKVNLDPEAFDAFMNEYEAAGCPSVHHSEEYRAAYGPAYRLVSQRFKKYFPIICMIEELLRTRPRHRIVIAIEGPSGSGKTRLSRVLDALYDCNVFHMDDFFLPLEQQTEERLERPGENIDYTRFQREVASKIRRGSPFAYHKYDCRRDSMSEVVYTTPKRLNIVEGVYSMHPAFTGLYDGTVFVTIDPETQFTRISGRNSKRMAQRYAEEWIPMENAYFEAYSAMERCDVVIDGAE